MIKERPKIRFKKLPISRMIPNIVTIVALCTGLSSIRFALMDKYELAVFAILVAAVLDALDGRLARLLNAVSDFGAELDSLSDFVNFGAAPGIVLYLCVLHELGRFGWALTLFFAVCMGLRLARFNTHMKHPERNVLPSRYFVGVPAPAGALLALLPLIISFAFELPLDWSTYVYAVFLGGAGALLISRIPTYSLKAYNISRHMVLPVLMFAGIVAVSLLNAPWMILTIIGTCYLISIPVSYLSFKRLRLLSGKTAKAKK